MDQHFKEYFHEFSEEYPSGNYHRVLALHEGPNIKWNEVKSLCPDMPRGWWELSCLKREERLEFTEQFWESKMSPFPQFCAFLEKFFKDVDEVGVFLTQKTFEAPFEAQIVYSLAGNLGFFRGLPPLPEEKLVLLKSFFPDCIFPQDYIAFTQIHNGFYKTTDTTGITRVEKLKESYDSFQAFFGENDHLATAKQIPVNPQHLIPFYTSFGMPFFQCFHKDWYPEQEMGNVYCSMNTKTVSDMIDSINDQESGECLSFPNFYNWLKFYLEKVE
ncbi:SMI1/KNR4 family protein [Estrella lausannensis]|uniref:SMI1/KNR4 family protein n=1 Tax=Estrella lausannensis TaxID=483423 RepID=A0A0H5DPX5_9BACT|nr:SMI1/KNR4 family protein [Estrella lausannensis]CRX38542.1 Conserved hypothetical protein [Estrella lausannensis]